MVWIWDGMVVMRSYSLEKSQASECSDLWHVDACSTSYSVMHDGEVTQLHLVDKMYNASRSPSKALEFSEPRILELSKE